MIVHNQTFNLTQHGSSLIQGIVCLGVLVPLAMSLPILAKIADFKLVSQQASRYMGWQTAIGSDQSDEQLNQMISHRVFNNNNQPITTQAPVNRQAPINRQATANRQAPNASLQRAQWQNQYTLRPNQSNTESETNSVFQNSAQSIATNHTNNALTARSQASMLIARSSARVAQGLSGVNFDVDFDGMQSHQMTFTIDHLGIAGQGALPLQIQTHHVMVSDHWAAESTAQTIHRVQTFVPGTRADKALDIVSIIGRFPIFGELNSLSSAAGHVAPDVISNDNLGEPR